MVGKYLSFWVAAILCLANIKVLKPKIGKYGGHGKPSEKKRVDPRKEDTCAPSLFAFEVPPW